MAVLNNTMMQGTAADIGAGDYQIPASIKFNKKHRNSLEKQPKYEGESRTWTLASWVKADNSAQPVYLFGSYYTNKEFAVAIDNDRLEITLTDSKAYYTNLKLRDPSAWWHLVIAVDSTNNAAIERVRIYINGKRIHSFATATQLSANEMSHWNHEHTTTFIGASRSDRFGDCQLADTIHIDGLCLPPSTFGKFDASNNWVPKDPKDADGNFTLPVVNDGTVWLDYLTYYNNTEANGYPVKQIFDDNITLRGGNGQASADNHFTFTPPNAFEDVDTFEIFFDHVYTQTRYRLKSGSTWGEWNNFMGAQGHVSANHGWEDCSMNIVDRNVSAIEIKPKSGETTVMYLGGFKVNGIQLINGQVDPDQLRNPNSHKTWNATSGTTLDAYSGIYNGELYTGSGGTIDGTARTLFDDDLVVNRQLELQTNDGQNTTITLTDANSNVYALRTNNDDHKYMILNSNNSSSTKTSFTGTLAGPVTIKQTSGASTISGVKLDGYVLRNNVGDNSFHLKYNETTNATQLGHDAFVDSATDTNPYYSGLINDFQNRTAWKAFDGTASDSSYVAGPNYGGIGVVDFTPLGGVAYNSLEVYMHQTNSGQFDAYRLNQSGSFADVPSSGGWGWITVDSNSGTLNTFEWRDSPNSSANGAAEGIFSALRINGSTILTNRGGNNFKVNNMHVGTDTGLTVTDTCSFTNGNNVFDGDESTSISFDNNYGTLTTQTINVIEKIEIKTNSGSNSGNADIFKDGNGTEYQIKNTGSTAWHKVTNTNASNSGPSLRGKIKGPWQIKRHSNGSALYGIKVDGVWLQDIPETYTDSLVDSPTNYSPAVGSDATGGVTRGNYATMNPLSWADHGYGGWTLMEGNLHVKAASGSDSRIAATLGASSGKWYWEVEELAPGTSSGIGINKEPNDYHATWNGTGDYVMYQSSGNKHINGSGTSYGNSYTKGDVIGVQWDADNGAIYFWKNGTIENSGTAARTGMSGLYTPILVCTSSGTAAEFNINFGQRPFKYTGNNRPSADYKCLCTQNLPDTFSGDQLNNPSKYFDIKTYLGSGVDDTNITGFNFGPDMVWTKMYGPSGGGYHHRIWDQARGVTKYLQVAETDDEGTEANGLQAFNADGFQVGTFIETGYTTTLKYVAYTWDAGTSAATASTDGSITPSAQWVNATAGFSITKFTGNETTGDSVGHALGAKPDFVIIKNLSVAKLWAVWVKGMEKTKYLTLNEGDESEAGSTTIWDNLDFTNTKVTLGANDISNKDGDDIIMYAWTAIPGYSSFGLYKGNGTASGPFIYTGFQPHWCWFKRLGGQGEYRSFDTVRETHNPRQTNLGLDETGVEYSSANYVTDFLSNGVKIRGTQAAQNTNNEDYVYMAWAEHPIKTARAQ